jgi:carbonic anhydrase/acetyltransferase-like protein (isoleucine patch superfamily)
MVSGIGGVGGGVAIDEASGYYPSVPIFGYQGARPRMGRRVYLAPTAIVAGQVEVGDDVSFWVHSVARGDVNRIRIGDRTNVQDGCVLHVTHETHPLEIGEDVVIGHGAIVHGCTLGDGALIGIGARVLDGAVVEARAQVGAGALVPPGIRVPAGSLVLGIPARVARPLTEAELAANAEISRRYVGVKDAWAAETGYGTDGEG